MRRPFSRPGGTRCLCNRNPALKRRAMYRVVPLGRLPKFSSCSPRSPCCARPCTNGCAKPVCLRSPTSVFVSIATMTGANFAALTQTNTKRLLAYSSIAHVGYMLLAFVAMGTSQPGSPGFNDGFKGILIYLLVYMFMNLGAFAVITSLRQRNVIGDEIDDMAGLYQRAPVEAALMLLFLLSLAGIPPAAGFLGKYYIFLSLIESGHYGLASLGVLYSLFGLYYYLKIANSMLM